MKRLAILIALLLFPSFLLANSVILPELPDYPILGYSAVICPASPTEFVEANIWVGIPKVNPTQGTLRFATECLYCPVYSGCQDQSIGASLDRVHFNWLRTNAACFPTQGADEQISVKQIVPRPIIREDGGGCDVFD